MKKTKSYYKDLIYQVNGAAIEVHKELGPGLLESVYHKCLVHELKLRKINFCSEMTVPIEYKGLELETNLRCDLFIENCLVVEIKTADKIIPIYDAQILSYMKLLDVPVGLMLNFKCSNMFKEGQKTFVNTIYKMLD